MRRRGLLSIAAVVLYASAAPAQENVPDEHRADRSEAPPRPGKESAQEPARRLFQAIVHDDPALAEDVFFPRDAFHLVKAMAHPERYYERLHQRFLADIHNLHASLKDLDRAEFVELDLGRRGGWIKPGEEGNRLPYWAARHTSLYYRVGDERRSLEVRVLITWGPRWYVIHLSEFH